MLELTVTVLPISHRLLHPVVHCIKVHSQRKKWDSKFSSSRMDCDWFMALSTEEKLQLFLCTIVRLCKIELRSISSFKILYELD